MTKRKFYRSVYQVEVLSEEPLSEDLNLAEIFEEITTGDCSGIVTDLVSNYEIDGVTCAKLLKKQGSCPSFFRLTDKGSDLVEVYF